MSLGVASSVWGCSAQWRGGCHFSGTASQSHLTQNQSKRHPGMLLSTLQWFYCYCCLGFSFRIELRAFRESMERLLQFQAECPIWVFHSSDCPAECKQNHFQSAKLLIQDEMSTGSVGFVANAWYPHHYHHQEKEQFQVHNSKRGRNSFLYIHISFQRPTHSPVSNVSYEV